MSILVLNLKRIYFDSIRIGTKGEEYRLCTPYWQKRLAGRDYDAIEIRLGYPANHELEKIMTFAWHGYRRTKLTHPHFGPEEVEVYAIDLSERLS
ncbi:ASCH domain-containing protein [Herbaspirillum huttiense]|uniref:ASCH domain-containing protein n=1 Tax=Herbaspirillum huttiense TaxID=863372 RepID=UPI003F2F1861